MSVNIDRSFSNHLAQVSIVVHSDDLDVASDMIKELERAAVEKMESILMRTYPNDYYDYRGFK